MCWEDQDVDSRCRGRADVDSDRVFLGSENSEEEEVVVVVVVVVRARFRNLLCTRRAGLAGRRPGLDFNAQGGVRFCPSAPTACCLGL